MRGYSGDMLRGLQDICESKQEWQANLKPHPDIVALYDRIENLLYDFTMCVYKDWNKRKDKYREEEARSIVRGIVGDIGQLWIHSPYFNKNHPIKEGK